MPKTKRPVDFYDELTHATLGSQTDVQSLLLVAYVEFFFS